MYNIRVQEFLNTFSKVYQKETHGQSNIFIQYFNFKKGIVFKVKRIVQ